jgi:hypothetical protein
VLGADGLGDRRRERVRRERAGRDDHRPLARDRGDLAALDRDARVRGQGARHLLGEALAIHGERAARGDGAPIRRAKDERSRAPELLFEQTHSVRERGPSERV